jgi:hypothetical protein
MAKITLGSLGIKKLNSSVIEIDYEGAPVEVMTYIPVPVKFAIINDAISLSYINGIFNPLAIEAVFHALLVDQLTNIAYTKVQQEHLIDTYDLLNESGLLQKICDALGDTYDEIVEDLMLILDKVENKQKTVAEQLTDLIKSISEGIGSLGSLDAENLELIKNVISKLESVPSTPLDEDTLDNN